MGPSLDLNLKVVTLMNHSEHGMEGTLTFTRPSKISKEVNLGFLKIKIHLGPTSPGILSLTKQWVEREVSSSLRLDIPHLNLLP